MFMLKGDKVEQWLKPEFVEEFEKYLSDKTKSKDGNYYYFNFENFLLRKGYICSGN